MKIFDGWFGVCSVILFGWLGVEAALNGLWFLAGRYILILLLIWAVHRSSMTIRSWEAMAARMKKSMEVSMGLDLEAERK